MATGTTTTQSLTDSLPTVIAAARIVQEYEGVIANLCDMQRLGEGIGNTWNEISLAKLTASAVSETTELDNPQAISDTLFSVTPTMVVVETLITERVAARISKNVYARIGSLAQNAIERKVDIDGTTALDSATTSLGGAGTTTTSGLVSAAVSRILGNATEHANPPVNCVLHPYQIKDFEDELVAGIGTYAIPEGKTARVFEEGFSGRISTAGVFCDGNITIDGSADAKGGVFSKQGLVLVRGRSPWIKTRDEGGIGGGATRLWHYDEYAYGERSAGNWLYELYTDATAPTS